MSWGPIHAQLVSIITGTTPGQDDLGLGSSFRHLESDREAFQPRSFSLMVESGAHKLPGLTCVRGITDVRLTVYYDEVTRASALNLAQVLDAETLIARLAEPANWDRSNNEIVSVGIDGEETVFEYEITDLGLEITFPVEYRRT